MILPDSFSRRGRAGFTLLEVLIATAIGMLVLGALYGIFQSFQTTKRITTKHLSLNTDAITALSLLQEDISMAGYGSNMSSSDLLPLCQGTFVNGAAAATNLPCVGIEFASPQKIIVATDTDGDKIAERVGYDVYDSSASNWNATVLGRSSGSSYHNPLILLRGPGADNADYFLLEYFHANGTAATDLESIGRVRVRMTIFWRDNSTHNYTMEMGTKNIGYGAR